MSQNGDFRMSRPQYLPSPQECALAAQMADAGYGQREIAAALHVSRNTMAKHLGEVLLAGRARARLRYLQLLERQAEAGSCTATMHLLRLTDRANERDAARLEELNSARPGPV
jgi:hypothetical protein